MPLNGEFIVNLRESMQGPVTLEVNGEERLVLPDHWKDATPLQAKVEPLTLSTLTGLVGYLTANRDALPLGECVAHVKDPGSVLVCANLDDEATRFRRHVFAQASTSLYGNVFAFGQFLDAETFTIGLQTHFVQTEDREALRLLVVSIKDSAVRETTDDGVAQQVTVAQGVRLIGPARVPNPVTLQPYRTFREVEQPASLFILRLKSGAEGQKPTLALFEADGGAWKLAAIKNVAAYLTGALGDRIAVLA